MRRYKLKNGLTVLIENRKTKSVVVEVTVKVGSLNETPKILGISHFIEHLVFEGTKKRESATIIANEIEKLGGDLNAATTYERTFYYAKVLNKHFDVALDVLSDIVLNPVFDERIIEKERKIIIEEINMIFDDPRNYQWYLFTSTLFQKHPAKHEVFGGKKTVSKITRKQILDFYNKYYVPSNMIVTVVGDVKKVLSKIEKIFSEEKKVNVCRRKKVIEPKQTKKIVKKEKRKIQQSYMVLGYKTVPRKHKDSYVLDVLRAVLAKGQSGRLFEEIRTKRGLAYDVGVYHKTGSDFGYFSVYSGVHKKNIKKVIDIILKEFDNLKSLSDNKLKEAKTYIEGDFLLSIDDNYDYADILSSWEVLGMVGNVNEYIKKIKKVSKADIKRVVDKYFTKNYTLTVVEQKE